MRALGAWAVSTRALSTEHSKLIPFPAMSALNDVVVVEFASGVAGPYCGRLLSDLGATVIKVETAVGDHMRGSEPRVNGESAFFNYLNAGKAGVVAEASAEELAPVLARADIVTHSLLGAEADALEARVKAANAAAIVLSLSPYGRTGERSKSNGWRLDFRARISAAPR